MYRTFGVFLCFECYVSEKANLSSMYSYLTLICHFDSVSAASFAYYNVNDGDDTASWSQWD